MEDESNIQLAYATHEDIAACCPTETVLAVRVNLVFHTSCSCHKYEPHVQWILSSKLCSGSWPLILSFNSFLKGPLRNPAWGAKTGGGNRGTKKIPDSSQSLCFKSPSWRIPDTTLVLPVILCRRRPDRLGLCCWKTAKGTLLSFRWELYVVCFFPIIILSGSSTGTIWGERRGLFGGEIGR